MKILIFLITSFIHLNLAADQAFSLGEEYIEPLKYPKFSLIGDTGLVRNFVSFQDKKLNTKLANNWGAGLGVDVGLYKYFNAGFMFTSNIPLETSKTIEPILFRFTLVAKPYVPIGDRFGLFARLGGGFGVSIFNELDHLRKTSNTEYLGKIKDIYYNQAYSLFAPSMNAMATIGLEVFPFSRFGISAEWGIRGEFVFASKGNAAQNALAGSKQDDPRAPKNFHYLVYDMPLMLNLHIIL